jgi:hypothetical protein
LVLGGFFQISLPVPSDYLPERFLTVSNTPQFLHDLILYGIPVAFIGGIILGGIKRLIQSAKPAAQARNPDQYRS